VEWALHGTTGVPLRRERFRDTRHEEESNLKTEQRLEEMPATDSPGEPSEDPTLLAPAFQTSGLHNCDTLC
jgi:hypothetical protein